MSAFACSEESREALRREITDALSLFRPKPPMTLSEWADEYAYIPAGSAEPGKFSVAAAAYQREPMDAITDPRIRRVVLIWASQTGKTQIQLIAMGYYSHQEPAYMLMIQPTIERAEEVSKLRIAPMIRDTPVLRDLFPDPKSRDSGNTLLLKEFPGGYLALVGANAPSGLASKPVRVLFPDEVDRFPESAGTEGDSLDLAYVRGSTFWNFKAVETSTPVIKGTSRIDQSFAESDQRYYMVPCPECGLEQVLMWGNGKPDSPGLKFVKDVMESGQVRPRDVHYQCVRGCRVEESSKYEMIRRGRWQASAESRDGRTAGYHLNALYSPWVEWSSLASEWLAAQGDVEKLQVFTNTRLAESWELRGDGAEESELAKRAEPAAEKLPEGVLLLTMGVDVQRDRMVATVWGWGMDKQAWVIDHRIFRGQPALTPEHPDSPWRELDDYRRERWAHPSGKMLPVSCVCVDSGDQTKTVYDFTRKRERERVYAIKGIAGFGKPLVNNGSRPDKNKTLLYLVGVDTAKERIYSSLKLEKPGPGYVHILKKECLGDQFLLELTAEHLVTRKVKGRPVMSFVLREGRRNEALDCAVYASAARELLRPNFPKLYERLWGKAYVAKPQPLAPAVQALADKLKTVHAAIDAALGPPKPVRESQTEPESEQPADPWAHLPKIGKPRKDNPLPKRPNWRDSWDIL